MKLVTLAAPDGSRLGALRDGRVADLAALAARGDAAAYVTDMLAFLRGGEAARSAVARLLDAAERDAAAWRPLAELRLLAPVANPRKILALAGNYQEHIREGGLAVQPKAQMAPQVFIKPVTCLIGPEEAIRLPGPICTAVDYEAELGVVIGRAGRNVPVDRAIDHVAGYLNFNDVSGRRLNIEVPREITPRTGFFDWLNGKWFDTFAPIGPWLALKDEVPDPQALDLELRVNGQVRQRASTADMVFGVAETVAWLSQFVTLEPGDLIATGTPSGVGAATGTFLQPGDVVEMEITGLGRLRNRVAPAP